MRILYHHRTMGDGAEGIHIREIVSALRDLGHEVRVEALAGDPTQPSASREGRLRLLRRAIPDSAYELAEIGYNVVGTRRLLRAIKQFKPDVIYDRYNAYSTAALRAARRSGLPLLLEVNAPVALERTLYEHLQLKFPRLARRYERTIFSGADRIFVVSTPLKHHLVEHIGIDETKIVVLPNGANPDVFIPGSGRDETRRRYGLEGKTVVGFTGILRPWHGVDLLLEAFADLRHTHPDAHLLIVGDGPMQAALESQARELAIADAVTFTGRVPHHEVVAHVAAMDIAVSPHATFYASPMKIMEYMAMRLPVVAPAMDNLRDIIRDGETGLLFAAQDREALATLLRQLVRRPQWAAQLGELARLEIVQRLNWKVNAQSILTHADHARQAQLQRSYPPNV